MNSDWNWKWTALWIGIILFFGFVFYDNGRPFIDFIYWITGG